MDVNIIRACTLGNFVGAGPTGQNITARAAQMGVVPSQAQQHIGFAVDQKRIAEITAEHLFDLPNPHSSLLLEAMA